jgi:uncharacterized protein YndB with AHSA1/START domain
VAEFKTSIDIEAPPEIVFAHLVTPERMITWMGERADLEPMPGGRFAVDIGGVPFRGEYLSVEAPRRVVISWGMAGNDDFPPGTSTVEFTLVPTQRGTTLHLVHTGLPKGAARRHGLGWRHYLSRLGQAAQGNPPGADPGFSTQRRTARA